MEDSKNNHIASYEVNIRYAEGIEIGFYANLLPDDHPKKRSYIRMEHGESDAAHGFIALDFETMMLSFGYDIIYVKKPFTVVEDKGNGEITVDIEGKKVVITKRK